MATLLDTLKSLSFFQGIHCPYELLVSLYHVALRFEGDILDETFHAEENPIGTYIAAIPLDAGKDSFDIDAALYVLEGMIRNEAQAALMMFELMNRLDLYLSGADNHQEQGKRGTAVPSRLLDLLGHPFYYQPLKVCIAGEEVLYTIIPRREPLHARWIKKPLPRDEAYFNQTLVGRCLKYHRLFRDERVGSQRVTFPANGAYASKHLSFQQTFEPSGKTLGGLTIALAPYDAGFEPELLPYDKTEQGTVPFRYVRTAKPSPAGVKAKIETILKTARDRGVDILIFPELVVDHDATTEIGRFLVHHNPSGQLKLVVAGSFHRERDAGGYVNQAPMFDWQGNIVWQHNKLSRYRLRHEEMGKSPRGRALRRRLKTKAGNHMEEKIHVSHPLAFVDTPIGRMATLICLDYLQETVIRTIREIGCDFLLVPLMTTSIDMFVSHAKDQYGSKLHVLSACSASVSCCEMFECKDKDLSFLYAPSRSFAELEKYPGRTEDEKLSIIIYRLDKTHL